MKETLQTTVQTEANIQKRRFLCPECGKHTILWILPETEIKNLPVKCKLCGKESVVNILPKDED